MSTTDPTATETRPPADNRTAGKTQAALLVAGSCMPVLGAVLLAPVLPTLNQVFADTPASPSSYPWSSPFRLCS
ncbi:hypothetical protein LN996_09710 [Arthrobacter sp. AK01]|uniref:hypothetical protein n=1 Tax=Arthrobacter sp. AK01 TaxID=2894084 RepID=UPI001E6325F3|nr:hypothetical protein [Arthrobacter sp. AK01]MCD4851084.1 hypothetical protein [Arthrobacter sp. AK01]